MNTTLLKMKRCGLGAFIALLLFGCRHPAPPGVRGADAARVFEGDPATNVIIVPVTAVWRARGGGTNLLPAGIVSANPFPFPEYDRSLVKSVYDRWHELLNVQPQPAGQGAVVVEFLLHPDGSVSRLRSLPSEVTPRLEELCQRAVQELAPFPGWPAEMLAEIGADWRIIRISFDFNTSKQASAAEEKRTGQENDRKRMERIRELLYRDYGPHAGRSPESGR